MVEGKIRASHVTRGVSARLGMGWGSSGSEQLINSIKNWNIDLNLIERLLWFAEDVGDEGEEEKEFISYNINIDIHYGVKSNRWVV